MDDVVAGGTVGGGGFGSDGGLDRSDVGLDCGFPGVARVPLEGDEADGRQHGEDRDHDDQFGEGESVRKDGLTGRRLLCGAHGHWGLVGFASMKAPAQSILSHAFTRNQLFLTTLTVPRSHASY